ncbi:hypothetical protein HW452_14270 [Halomonas aquamarina]|uniref:Uncharacterized protein n=1 Tax=Vreelandella aquamarina TaxID=77097 RepID=A0ACC5VY77_9GAMM|nr:hypothetical protein [Halomonas aquamarina]MBZ5488689.1 hypothetical protein [Halomonas aquamarina]
MIEGILEGFARSVGWFLGHVVSFVIFRVGYFIGWPLVKCLTLGAYPGKRRYQYGERQYTQEELWTSCLGVLIAITLAVYIYTR